MYNLIEITCLWLHSYKAKAVIHVFILYACIMSWVDVSDLGSV